MRWKPDHFSDRPEGEPAHQGLAGLYMKFPPSFIGSPPTLLEEIRARHAGLGAVKGRWKFCLFPTMRNDADRVSVVDEYIGMLETCQDIFGTALTDWK